MASNFPTAYVRVASQTYVLQHIVDLQTHEILLDSDVESIQWVGVVEGCVLSMGQVWAVQVNIIIIFSHYTLLM